MALISCCTKCPGISQVYRAVRNSVQDAAVKLLTNVDANQLATFSQVSTTQLLCSALPFQRGAAPSMLCVSRQTGMSCSHVCFAPLSCQHGNLPG